MAAAIPAPRPGAEAVAPNSRLVVREGSLGETGVRRRGRGSRLSSPSEGLPSVPPRRCAPPNLQSRKQQPFRLLQEDETMTIKSKLTTLSAAGVLTAAVAAHAPD